MSSEETVRVDLGDDYYQGAYFVTEGGHLDYEIPCSQLERWEAAKAAYENMQGEIEQVMKEQRDSARALLRARREASGDPTAFLRKLYEPSITAMLRTQQIRQEGDE